MAELNEKQQCLYDKLILAINIACYEKPNNREFMIRTLDELIEDLLNERNNYR